MIYNIKDKKSLDIASNLINMGEIIVYPTDTIYGFGVDATNSEAINKLNKLKKRKQVYSIIVSSFKMLNRYSKLTFNHKNQIENYLPGPYTLILEKRKSDLSDLISLDLNTVGIRIPKHFFPINLVEKLNKPIVTTSVNFHNSVSITNIDDIKKAFPDIEIFKDSETPSKIKSSTIIDFTDSKLKILRK